MPRRGRLRPEGRGLARAIVAETSAPTSAPAPKHAVTTPKISGPDCSVCFASTGRRTLKLKESVVTSRTVAGRRRRAASLRTNANASRLPRTSVGRSRPGRAGRAPPADQQQAGENGDEADGVEQEAGAGPDRRSPHRRAPGRHARRVEETELRATAFGSSSRPTSWNVKAWRPAGRPRGDPTEDGEQEDHPGRDDAAEGQPASTAAKTIDTACVAMTVRRTSSRSTSTPLKSPSTVAGRNWQSTGSRPRPESESAAAPATRRRCSASTCP